MSTRQLDNLLDKHIKAGRTIDDFVNSKEATTPIRLTGIPVDSPADKLGSSNAAFIQLVHEVATALRPQADPLQHLVSLKLAVEEGWLLSTQEVKRLIEVKLIVSGSDRFIRGNFVFVRSGKIGSQTSWRVVKVTLPEDPPLDTAGAQVSP